MSDITITSTIQDITPDAPPLRTFGSLHDMRAAHEAGDPEVTADDVDRAEWILELAGGRPERITVTADQARVRAYFVT